MAATSAMAQQSLILVRIVLDLIRGRDVAELEAQLRGLEEETRGNVPLDRALNQVKALSVLTCGTDSLS